MLPAMSGNGFQSLGTKPITAQKRQRLKLGKIRCQKLQTLVANRHPFQPKLLEERIRLGENTQPRMHISAPILWHQIEIRKPRFAFQRHAPDLREPSGHNLRRHRVTVSDEHVAPAPPLGVVPVLTD